MKRIIIVFPICFILSGFGPTSHQSEQCDMRGFINRIGLCESYSCNYDNGGKRYFQFITPDKYGNCFFKEEGPDFYMECKFDSKIRNAILSGVDDGGFDIKNYCITR